MSVADDDTGLGDRGTIAVVNNVDPIVTSLSGPASINENDTFSLSGSYIPLPGTRADQRNTERG